MAGPEPFLLLKVSSSSDVLLTKDWTQGSRAGTQLQKSGSWVAQAKLLGESCNPGFSGISGTTQIAWSFLCKELSHRKNKEIGIPWLMNEGLTLFTRPDIIFRKLLLFDSYFKLSINFNFFKFNYEQNS